MTVTLTAPDHCARTSTPPSFDRALSPAELDDVVAAIRGTDYEHGLTACLAVDDVVAADLGFGSAAHMADQLRDHVPQVAIPLHQWFHIAHTVEAAAHRDGPGGESAVLADWVTFGPRVSAR